MKRQRPWQRPLHSRRQRQAAFAFAALAIGAAALLLIHTTPPPTKQSARTQPLPRAASEPERTPVETAPAPSSPLPLAEGKQTTRRFLAAYLRFRSGGVSAAALAPHATAELVQELDTARPHAGAASGRHPARVLAVTGEEITSNPNRLVLRALIAEGGSSYTMIVHLVARGAGWRVASVEAP